MKRYWYLTPEQRALVDADPKVVAAHDAAILADAALDDDAGAADSQATARAAVITARAEAIKRMFGKGK